MPTKAIVFFTRTEPGASSNDPIRNGINKDGVNLDTETSTNVLIDGNSSSYFVPAANTPVTLTFNAALHTYYTYLTATQGATYYGSIYSGDTSTGAIGSLLYSPLTTTQINNYYTGYVNDIVDDPANHKLYFTQQVLDADLDVVAAQTGIYVMNESGGTATRLSINGLTQPSVLAVDTLNNLVFFTDSTGYGYLGGQSTYRERLDVANLTTGVVTVLVTQTFVNDAYYGSGENGGKLFSGLAIDPTTHTLVFTTNNPYNTPTDSGIYKTTYAVTGTGATAAATIGGITTLYSGTNSFDPSAIVLDVADGLFYVSGNTPQAVGGGVYNAVNAGIYEGSLTATNTTALTRVTPLSETAGDSSYPQGQQIVDLAIDIAPIVTAGATVTWVVGAAAIAVDSTLAISAQTSPSFVSGTVVIGSVQTGDTLAAVTTGTSITASYSAGTLTLSGTDTAAHYQQVLDSVTYSSAAGDPTVGGTALSRTLTYAVYDGIISSAAVTSTVSIQAGRSITAGATVIFTGGGSPVVADAALTLTDGVTSTLTGATISVTTGHVIGDILGFTAQNGISGAFNGTTGVLTLSGTATLAQYQTAIDGITFGFSPSNADPTNGGASTSRTISYIFSDASGTSTGVTSTVTVVHAVPSIVAGANPTYLTGGTAVVIDAGLTLTAPDSSGLLASATVTIAINHNSADVLNFTNQNGITGSYNGTTGVLSLTGSATSAQYQAAIESITFSSTSTSSTSTRGLSYTVNDGTASSSAATSTITVNHPTPGITGAVAGQAVSDVATIAPFAGITVTDSANQQDSATITVTASGVPTDADGTLSGTGLTKTGTGTYTLAATTPAGLTTALAALLFTPTAHQVAAGSTVTTGFTLAIADTGAGSATNATTTVVATGTPILPPAPTGLTLAPASDSGTLLDGITDIATPVITGTGVAGDTITLFDGATQIGTALVGGDGSWAVTTSSLALGSHTLTAIQSDPSANVGPSSTGMALTIAAVPAAASGLTLAPASDSGTLLDGITDIATPVITGAGVAGDTITLFDGATQVGTAVVGGDGSWAVTTSSLAVGSHTLTAVQHDPAGNPAPSSAGLALTIAAIPAAATGLTLAPASDSGTLLDGITDITTPVITGSGVAGDTIALFDGVTQVGTALVGGDGTWSITTSGLAIGAHTLTAVQSDPAGNPGPSSAGLALIIAAMPGAATGLTLAPGSDSGTLLDGITIVTTPVITGVGVAGDTIVLFDGATQIGSTTVDGSGAWSITTSTLAVGAHTLTAIQQDPAGNPSASSIGLPLTIAAVPAAATALTLAPASDTGTLLDGITDLTTPVITGSGVAGDTIALFDGATQIGTALVGGDGTWSITSSTLALGAHTLVAVQSDPAGNAAPSSTGLAVTIAAVPAAATGLALSPNSDTGILLDGITDIATPVITGNGVAGGTITLFDGETQIGSALVGIDGTWSITTNALAVGSHTLTALQSDAAGNPAPSSAGLALTIAAVPAAATGLTLAPASDSGTVLDGMTDIATPMITGSGVAGNTITLFDGATQIGSALVGIDGTWSITTSALAVGAHTLTAVQSDPSGNPAPSSAVLALTISAVPAVATGLALAPASDSGTLLDGITDVTTPVVTGGGIAGNTIALFDGETQIGTAIVGSDGLWSITASTLAVGGHTLTAIQSDPAGNSAPSSAAFALTIAAVPAAATGLTLAAASDSGILLDGITDVAAPVITGNGIAGDTIALFDGATQVGTTVVGGDGTWSIASTALAIGPHMLTAVQSDPAGNPAPSSAGLALTIAAIPAAATDLTLAAASDSGTALDGNTVITTPVITGSGVVGQTIALFDGATQLGATVVGSDGTWSITTSALAIGSHTLTAVQSDAAGNPAPNSTALALTIDAVPAAATGLTLAPASDSGILLDGTTVITTPVITGSGVAGDSVTLFDGATPIGSAVVGADGTWSITSSPLAVGAHSLTAIQSDPAGNPAASSAGLTLTINPAPATAQGLTLASGDDSGTLLDGRTDITTPMITGSGIVGDTVTLFDGAVQIGTTIVGAGGTWSIVSSSLAAGAHTLTAVQSDPLGNPSLPSTALTVTIDAVPTAATGLTLAPSSDSGTLLDNVTDIATPVITGNGVAGNTIALFDGLTQIGTAIVGSDGGWSAATSALAVGAHAITAVQSDPAGNAAPVSAALTLTVAAVPAAATGLALAPGSDSGTLLDNATIITTPVITGSGVATDTITLFDGANTLGTAVVSGGGTWSIMTGALAIGPHTLTAIQSDELGNAGPTSIPLVLTISAAPPAAAGLTLAPASDSGVLLDNITKFATPAIRGTGVAADAVALFDGLTQIGAAVVGNDGIWVISASALADGVHTLTALQTDAAGNAAALSGGLTLTIDTTPPIVTAAIQNGKILAGAAEPNGSVTIADNGTAIGSTAVSASGAWSYDLSSLAAGTHALVASETDAAGNTGSAASLPLTVAPTTVADTRFSLSTGHPETTGQFFGSDYTGAVSGLEAEYGYVGVDNVVLIANVPDVFIYGSAGDDALAVKGGSNVIDGGGGSNWMVGGTGADGGTDNFFVDNRGGAMTWDTLVNFHAGDMLTIWGFDAAKGTMSWSDNMGIGDYKGATLQAGLGDGTGGTDIVTFAGTSSATAQFTASTGTVGGLNYLAVIRTA